MTARYRRKRPSKGDSLAAAAVSVAIGAGVAAVTFYFTRLMLSRDPLSGAEAVLDAEASTGDLLPSGDGASDGGSKS